jgi:hypothetical protein
MLTLSQLGTCGNLGCCGNWAHTGLAVVAKGSVTLVGGYNVLGM